MISTPYMQGDYIYGVDSYGELRCLEAATGDRVWEDRTAVPEARWSNIHMVRNDDRVWMFNERGELLRAGRSLIASEVMLEADGAPFGSKTTLLPGETSSKTRFHVHWGRFIKVAVVTGPGSSPAFTMASAIGPLMFSTARRTPLPR